MPSFFVSERSFGSKILSLKHPTTKMSKSEKEGCLFLLDNEQEIKKKIMRAETDSENKIYYDPKKKPGISNLLVIFSVLTNKNIKETENLFINSDYFFFKTELVNVLQKKFFCIQNEYKIYSKDIKLLLEKDNIYFKNKASKKILSIKKSLFLKNI